MQEMFEKRRVSLKKLAAKHTRPVQPVAPRPEAIKSPLSSPGESLYTTCPEVLPVLMYQYVLVYTPSAPCQHTYSPDVGLMFF